MATGDNEVTLGEISRNLQNLAAAVRDQSTKMVTTEVWSTERQMLDLRFQVMTETVTKLAATLEKERAERVAEREKDRLEAKADRDKVQSFRRQITFAILTSLAAPVVVALVLLVINPGGS